MNSSESLNHRWWKEDTVAVVTGANKGIGYAIVRQLAEHGIRVILAARDEERGKAAVKTVNDEGFHNVVFHQVDVEDEKSIHLFANWMKEHYGKLDILISPGTAAEGLSESYEMAKKCIDTNYYGTKRMVEVLLPLLKFASKDGGRIVNVSSSCGVLEHIPSDTLRQQLSNLHDLTGHKIDTFLQSFLALNTYTRLLALQHPDLYVNCVHPGVVKTDMNFNTGWLSVDEGAKGPVMVALLPPGLPSGQYYDEMEIASFDVLPKIEGP